MAIIGSAWSVALFADLSGKGLIGSKLMDFTDAVGNGSATHIVGKAFTTTDVGTVPGTGTGIGTGIVGLVGANISSLIQSTALASFGQSGSKLADVSDSIGTVCVAQMALATLSSIHSPVFVGSGIVDIGSIPVVGAGWGSAIDSEGAGSGFIGSQWPNFAQAIGIGSATEVLAAGTGTVAISGSPSGVPVPGAGTGTGTIS